MRVAYICHPIGGDVQGNLAKIRRIVRIINMQGSIYVPSVPYYADCVSMNDDDPDERARGFENNKIYFDRKFMDELWVFTEKVSQGMSDEIGWALEKGIEIKKATLVEGERASIIISKFEVPVRSVREPVAH